MTALNMLNVLKNDQSLSKITIIHVNFYSYRGLSQYKDAILPGYEFSL